MKSAAEDKLATLVDEDVYTEVLKDIIVLHKCPSEDLFDVACRLFIQKWKAAAPKNITTFLDYFQAEWIKSHKGWFLEFIWLRIDQ